MSWKDTYKEHLTALISETLKTGNNEKLAEYLASNSNLPGHRGNLELAQAFVNVVAAYAGKEPKNLWHLCKKLTQLSPSKAPVKNPKEFLVFCGTLGIGTLGTTHTFFPKAISRLKEAVSDARWRTREGFEYMRQSAGQRDADILWIVKQNLKKNRLTKNFPEEVASTKKLLQ